VEGYTNAVIEAVYADHGYERADEINVRLCGQTNVQEILAPLPRQSSGIHDDPMDHFHSGVGKHTVMVVLTLDRCRCESVSSCLTERTEPGLPHFGRDGDTLGASSPGSRR